MQKSKLERFRRSIIFCPNCNKMLGLGGCSIDSDFIEFLEENGGKYTGGFAQLQDCPFCKASIKEAIENKHKNNYLSEEEKEKLGKSLVVCKKCGANLVDGGCEVPSFVSKLIDDGKVHYIGGEPVPVGYKRKCPVCRIEL